MFLHPPVEVLGGRFSAEPMFLRHVEDVEVGVGGEVGGVVVWEVGLEVGPGGEGVGVDNS